MEVDHPADADASTGRKRGKKKSAEQHGSGNNGYGIKVSEFDHCVENHFRAMDTIARLCGEADDGNGGIEESEIERFSSSIIFLREWKYFNYGLKSIKFACETRSPEGMDAEISINLPQFSSAAVFKNATAYRETTPLDLRDFVMYVGGPVWALDWCPQVHERNDFHIKCEFIAVSAHPPGSSYHKMGAPLTGRGLVQIWCMVNVTENQQEVPTHAPKCTLRPKKKQPSSNSSSQLKRPRGRPPGSIKNQASSDMSSQPKRPRGRPRKKQVEESNNNYGNYDQSVQPLATEYTVGSSNPLEIDGIPESSKELVLLENSDERQMSTLLEVPMCNSRHEVPLQNNNHFHCMGTLSFTGDGVDGSIVNLHANDGEGPSNISKNAVSEVSSTESSILENVALPRVVLCLAHNGKVAWDLKWKPSNPCTDRCKLRMGYLAVLLGNGSLEVWEVPCPNVLKAIYCTSHGEGTDPRFVKLDPILRCSVLKCGNIHSIPLTVEWSSTPPHDYLLVGCHDGTVALFKFSPNRSCKDARPLLRFSADTVPIRGVAWAPNGSDPESANVILTAGHGGIKFWDLRDPFRPLWDLHPALRNVYSLDWLSDPRCVILSFDDGTLRILSLLKAAYDVPVTGKPFTGTKQQGLCTYSCSSYAIWSVQVSRLTGMVAYCSADGAIRRFQLTTRAVEKDPTRTRTPHFVCGYFTEERSIITINSSESDVPVPLRKLSNKSDPNLSNSIQSNGDARKTARASTSESKTLALCYGNDIGIESGSEDALRSIKGKNHTQSNCKKGLDNQGLECNDELTVSPTNANASQVPGEGCEVYPSKSVAVHRVRWNMNKGSERWLCSGGAAGILRCQEIVLSELDKKLMMKK